MTKKEKELLLECLKHSHPCYLGEDFYASIRYGHNDDITIIFYPSKPYDWFIGQTELEIYLSASCLLDIHFSIQVQNGVPVAKFF